MTVVMLAVMFVALGTAAQPAAADFRMVSPTGTDTGNDCLILSGPCATIQHAIDMAANGDWVDVGAGTYAENVTIDKPLTLLGPNGSARPGEPQAELDGGSGTAITLESPRITIRGMAVTSDATAAAIRAPGADIEELEVEENLISGGSAGVRLDSGGEKISIGFNLIEDVGDGIHLGGASYSTLTIQANEFDDSIGGHAVLTDSGTTIAGIEFWGNQVSAPIRIARITKQPNRENDLGWNSFDSKTGPQLAVNGDEVRVMSNTFEGNDSAGCLQILGNQAGLSPSTHVLVSGDEFIGCNPYGVELGPTVDDISIFGNEFPGSFDGVVTSNASPWNVTDRVAFRDNRFVGTTHLGIDNPAAGTLDAEENWWGCNDGPGSAGCDGVSGGVNAANNVTLAGLIGPPQDEEDGLIEIPDGGSITLNPGDQAEVAAVLTTNGSGPNLGVPHEKSPISFSSSLGTLSPAVSSLQNGWTMVRFTAGASPGKGWISVSMDNQHTLVPVTIRGGPESTTLPTKPAAEPGPHAPTVGIIRSRTLPAARRIIIGTISCMTSCRVAPGRTWLVVDHRRYRARVTPRGALAAESVTPITIRLSSSARRALANSEIGRIRGRITVVDAVGQRTTRAVSVKVGR